MQLESKQARNGVVVIYDAKHEKAICWPGRPAASAAFSQSEFPCSDVRNLLHFARSGNFFF